MMITILSVLAGHGTLHQLTGPAHRTGRRPVTATHAAWEAAEAVRAVNRLTLHGRRHHDRSPDHDRSPGHDRAGYRDVAGYQYPADVDAVIGAFVLLAQRLPQALRQAAGWLGAEHTAGRVGHDQDSDTATVVSEVLADLEQAVHSAEVLATDLQAAHANSTHLTGVIP